MIHFTPREKEVLKGIDDGLTKEEMRLRMKPDQRTIYPNVGIGTVGVHISNIYKKLRENGYDFKGKNSFERRLVLISFAHYYKVHQAMKLKNKENKKNEQ